MNKYKNYWYELKHYKDLIRFCFYDTKDKMQNTWCFNAESHSLKDCIDTISAEKENKTEIILCHK